MKTQPYRLETCTCRLAHMDRADELKWAHTIELSAHTRTQSHTQTKNRWSHQGAHREPFTSSTYLASYNIRTDTQLLAGRSTIERVTRRSCIAGSRAVAGHCKAAFARQCHSAAGVDVVDPHPYAGDTLVAADAPKVGLAQRSAALRRRAVRRVIHRCRGLAQLEVLVCHATDGVGALHCGEGHHGDEQRSYCLCFRHWI